jgi:hypothetical protein
LAVRAYEEKAKVPVTNFCQEFERCGLVRLAPAHWLEHVDHVKQKQATEHVILLEALDQSIHC